MKVIIIGAGIAGLAIGWRLAQAGGDVEVVERGLAGQGATWAAAGMLAATGETGMNADALSRFADEARKSWPRFAREIEASSGSSIDFRISGAVLVAFDEAQERKLVELAASLAAKSLPGGWLNARSTLIREPLLAPSLHGALYLPDAAQVDNRALGPALAVAFARVGGKLREFYRVQSLIVENARVRGVATDQGDIFGDVVVLAAGAWCSHLDGMSGTEFPPVRPVKGQMVALVPPAGAPMPRYPVRESEIYVVPRQGRVLVGATVEEAGFDSSVTHEARDWLVAGAVRLLPSLAEWRIAECWAGLRPATPDNLLALGPTEINGLFAATGQFRNGILFAPAIADALHRLVMGETAGPVLRSFDPRRFGPRSTNAAN